MGFKFYKLRSFMTLEKLVEFFGSHDFEVETHFDKNEQVDHLVVSARGGKGYFFLEQFKPPQTQRQEDPK